jgi:hypothetical protein
MQLKDYIAIVALVVSGISLYVSFRATRLNLRAKSAEMRALLLSKILEASLTQSRVDRHRAELLFLCKEHDHFQLYQKVSELDPGSLARDIKSTYESIETLPPETGIDTYERYFHWAQAIAERSKDQEDQILGIRSFYDKKMQSIQSK